MWLLLPLAFLLRTALQLPLVLSFNELGDAFIDPDAVLLADAVLEPVAGVVF